MQPRLLIDRKYMALLNMTFKYHRQPRLLIDRKYIALLNMTQGPQATLEEKHLNFIAPSLNIKLVLKDM